MAIVHDTDEAHPSIDDFDVDARRAGVQRVLDQLLDDRSRPLDYLTGGDSAGNLWRENADRHKQTYSSPFSVVPVAKPGPDGYP